LHQKTIKILLCSQLYTVYQLEPPLVTSCSSIFCPNIREKVSWCSEC